MRIRRKKLTMHLKNGETHQIRLMMKFIYFSGSHIKTQNSGNTFLTTYTVKLKNILHAINSTVNTSR